jgi:hypothetical protein
MLEEKKEEQGHIENGRSLVWWCTPIIQISKEKKNTNQRAFFVKLQERQTIFSFLLK